MCCHWWNSQYDTHSTCVISGSIDTLQKPNDVSLYFPPSFTAHFVLCSLIVPVCRTTAYPGLRHKFSRYLSRYLHHRSTGALPWSPVQGHVPPGNCSDALPRTPQLCSSMRTPPTCCLGKLGVNFNLNGNSLELFQRESVLSALWVCSSSDLN